MYLLLRTDQRLKRNHKDVFLPAATVVCQNIKKTFAVTPSNFNVSSMPCCRVSCFVFPGLVMSHSRTYSRGADVFESKRGSRAQTVVCHYAQHPFHDSTTFRGSPLVCVHGTRVANTFACVSHWPFFNNNKTFEPTADSMMTMH